VSPAAILPPAPRRPSPPPRGRRARSAATPLWTRHARALCPCTVNIRQCFCLLLESNTLSALVVLNFL
jgi:hypothetical protein